MVLQSVIFNKRYFTKESAREWLRIHNLKSSSIEETDSFFRFRQRNPSEFDENSFRTVKITKGITSVMGKLKHAEAKEEWIVGISNIQQGYKTYAIIRKEGNEYVLYSHKGKKLGTFKTKEAALKREREINYFKHLRR